MVVGQEDQTHPSKCLKPRRYVYLPNYYYRSVTAASVKLVSKFYLPNLAVQYSVAL